MMAKTILGDQWMVNGSVSANFHLAVYDDNGNEITRSIPHTVCLMPDADYDFVLAAVNADITTREGMKWPPIPPGEWARVKSHCAVEHTPEVKAAYEKFKARNSELKARGSTSEIARLLSPV